MLAPRVLRGLPGETRTPTEIATPSGTMERRSIMAVQSTGLVESVKNDIIGAVKGTGDIAKATVDTVSNTLSTTLKDTGKVGASATGAIADVAGGAIRGASHVGAHLGTAAKGTVIGVLRGTRHVGDQAIDTIGHTAGSVIEHTAAVGGDLGHAATGLVEGAIHSAKGISVSGENAASAAAHGALKAADKVGSTAVETVRHAVTQTISGVKVVLKEPFKGKTGK